ncbi:hexosaminidase D-like [Pararge aegeria]|uniref:hexosaminidase D-like n=1 Tax=Pararge aegeria TaxID=116150 RepID=UPI0019D1CA8E|nr:hexosaminidase D-like [Pararge aegeria]
MHINKRKRYRLVTIKFFMVSAILFSIYLFISYYTVFQNSNMSEKIKVDGSIAINLPNVVMHLDLKGFPPKISYLKSLLTKLQELGVTGFLIEYEDMFPYEGRLVNLSAKYAYKKTELQKFLKTVASLGFDIIPLVQTFGHMEHVLKLKEFAHLRELSLHSNVICPSKPESRMLIRNMLEQVIKFHQNIFPLKYFHIGSDEVYHINKCRQCLQRNLTKSKMFLDHVKATADFVKKISPKTTVLMWDDMLRNFSIDEWKDVKNLSVDPVYWSYGSKEKISHIAMYQYHKKFENIWIASAFKGADGSTATLPDLKERLLNHLSWMVLIQNYKFGGEQNNYSFKGIILTGWSRYSHTSPPCELLPVSIPSLFLNLLLIKKFKDGYSLIESNDLSDFYNRNMINDISRQLRCSKLLDIKDPEVEKCNFDGNDLYKTIAHCDEVTEDIATSIEAIIKNYTDFEYIDQNIKWYNKHLNDLFLLEKRMMKKLSAYYDRNYVTEYVNYKLRASKGMLFKFLRLNSIFM